MTAARDGAKTALLRDLIARRSLQRGAFTLASGASSSFYFNMKETTLHPDGALLIADLMLAILAADPVDYAGGLEMGAVPIAACLALRSAGSAHPVQGFYVRKHAKNHGTGGRIDVALRSGARAAILEDVTTTGASALEAAEAVRAAGLSCTVALTVVDRGAGARARLENHGIRLVPLLSAADFGLG